jgi:hypothetical protein
VGLRPWNPEVLLTASSVYQNLIKEEDLIYQKLSDELPDEQAGQLERYFEAVSSTSFRKETLTYVQGMKLRNKAIK